MAARYAAHSIVCVRARFSVGGLAGIRADRRDRAQQREVSRSRALVLFRRPEGRRQTEKSTYLSDLYGDWLASMSPFELANRT